MAYGSLVPRPLMTLGLILALTACSTDAVMVQERVDRTGSVRPMAAPDAEERTATYPAAQAPSTTVAEQSAPAAGMPDTQFRALPAQGIDIDAMVSGPPVVGLAEEQSLEIADPQAGPPVVDGIGTNGVHAMSVPVAPAAIAAPPGNDPDLPALSAEAARLEARRKAQFIEQEERVALPRRAAGGEQQVAFIPRVRNPVSEPDFTGQMPASELSCRKRLTRLGVTFQDVPRISNGPSCGIDYPIRLSGLSGSIAVKPAVTLNCEVTEAFALWVKNELAPAARYRYLSGIGTVKPLGGYSCRTMNSRRGAAMSEHAHGNAIDIGKFVLKNGKEIDVRKPGFFAFREKGLLKAVRQDSCKYFNTVLGPGSDPFHKDHFHFDLRNRKSGYRHCD